jgi:hypothetical protein
MANDKRVNLTITIDKETREKLYFLVPEGKIGEFIHQLIKDKIKEFEDKVISEYQQAAEDQELNEQLIK